MDFPMEHRNGQIADYESQGEKRRRMWFVYEIGSDSKNGYVKESEVGKHSYEKLRMRWMLCKSIHLPWLL